MITYLNKSNKKRVVSTLFLYLLIIFLFACDFEQPEKWETPSWYINLTVPLTNEQYYFDGMLQDDVILEDTTNNTMGILFSGDIASGGEKPGITDAIFDFKIDRNEQSNLLD